MPTMVEITRRSKERKAKALALRRSGKTLKEVGEAFGVCKQTAKQMVDSALRLEARKANKS